MSNYSSPQFTREDLHITKTERIFESYLKIDRYSIKHRLFKGGWSDEFTREFLIKPQTVTVLLFDPVKDLVVLVEQLRLGALHHPGSPWLLEPVAGIVEHNEIIEETAQREVLEEAGCKVRRLLKIDEYLTSSGSSSEMTHVYCGLIDAPDDSGVFGIEHEDEDIRTHVLPLTAVLEMRRAGRFKTAAALISLYWLELNHQSLKGG